jgi:uncharacterized protein YndB with AHSA1/START domain
MAAVRRRSVAADGRDRGVHEEGEHTRITLTQTGFESAAVRDGHREGWTSTLDRLASLAEARS